MEMSYEKQIKHRLIDLDMSQAELMKKVTEKTGKYLDSSYMRKIYRGDNHPKEIIGAINEILGI